MLLMDNFYEIFQTKKGQEMQNLKYLRKYDVG